ncbi:MAG: serine hydrolase [Leptolyngbya sp. SIO4C5]|nr:serine hydrolase [Leptolyngbya sp. SIO4C5]
MTMANYGDRSRPTDSHQQAVDPFAQATPQAEPPQSPPAASGERKLPPQPQMRRAGQRRPVPPPNNAAAKADGAGWRQWLGGSPRRRPVSGQRDLSRPLRRNDPAARSAPSRLKLPAPHLNTTTSSAPTFGTSRRSRSPRSVYQPAQHLSQTPMTSTDKVTPLRPRQVWPPHSSAARTREIPPRRAHRAQMAAPPPIIYAMRLLILGIGVAAIAGTLLSVLSPDRVDYATTNSRNPVQSATNSPTRPLATLVNRPIQLGAEIAHLKAEIEELGTLTPGLTQSVFLLDLDNNAYVDIAGTEAMPAASTIKTPILVAFLQAVDAGIIQLDQPLVMSQAQIVGGSGEMQAQPAGTQYSALEVATEMIVNSDNTATNMLIDLLGGPEALNQKFRDWGLDATVMRNPLPDLDGTNTTSPKDLATLMALVNRGDLLTLRSRDRLLSIMQRTHTKTLIPAGLDSSAIVANKTGDIGSALGDVALVDLPNGKRYAIAAIVQRPHNDGRARELIRRISQTVYQEFTQAVGAPGGTVPTAPEPEIESELAPQG